MAREGGIGIIHKNLSPERQAAEVDMVKRSESGMISNPVALSPDKRPRDALQLMHKFHISKKACTSHYCYIFYLVYCRTAHYNYRIIGITYIPFRWKRRCKKN